jgi:hypothetical protein
LIVVVFAEEAGIELARKKGRTGNTLLENEERFYPSETNLAPLGGRKG